VDHLSSEELGAYLSNTLDETERPAVERHLVSCADCRADLIETQRATSTAPGNKRSWQGRFYALGLAAAAVIAFAVWPRGDLKVESEPVERNRAVALNAVVTIVSPRQDGEFSAQRAFVWRRNDDASYHITLTDASGRTLWSQSTSDTTATLPSTVALSRGQQYFWYVDALRSDGRSVTSGVNGFHVSR
jgi:hypothetical protein